MMTMSINMGSISNNSSSSNNMAYCNTGEYNGQHYPHDPMAYNNIQDPYGYQHNQYNTSQYNYHHHHHHHHHPNTNKIKNDEILKKFNQFFHNDLANTSNSSEQMTDNIVTVCNGLSYTNLDYHHYNEHLVRKHQYESSCEQYQKQDRYHEYYSENSQEKREHFVNNFKDRVQEHADSKNNYVGYDGIVKEPLHASDQHDPVCPTLPHRTEHFMHNNEPFDEATSVEISNKVHFHENVPLLNNKTTFHQHIEPRHAQNHTEGEQHFDETSKTDQHFNEETTRRSIIKERHPCRKVDDKPSNNEKCEEFIQYDRDYFIQNFDSDSVSKPRTKANAGDKISENIVKAPRYSNIISPPHEYCQGHADYNEDYYNDINIKEEDYDLGNYYHSEYYPHANHTMPTHTHHQDHLDQQNLLSSCSENSASHRISTDTINNTGNSTPNSSSKTAVVPTYKWMQVKRNVPKPQDSRSLLQCLAPPKKIIPVSKNQVD
ncbi:hypothetical protein WDU94_007216 [Cyamophila willieti]